MGYRNDSNLDWLPALAGTKALPKSWALPFEAQDKQVHARFVLAMPARTARLAMPLRREAYTSYVGKGDAHSENSLCHMGLAFSAISDLPG